MGRFDLEPFVARSSKVKYLHTKHIIYYRLFQTLTIKLDLALIQNGKVHTFINPNLVFKNIPPCVKLKWLSDICFLLLGVEGGEGKRTFIP